jgi:hypothetical protein
VADKLYKAVIHFQITNAPLGRVCLSNAKLEAAIKDMEIRVWLETHHFDQPINIYDNTGDNEHIGTLVVVHKDRDAMLLLKLAM